jgi:hypothetical protein
VPPPGDTPPAPGPPAEPGPPPREEGEPSPVGTAGDPRSTAALRLLGRRARSLRRRGRLVVRVAVRGGALSRVLLVARRGPAVIARRRVRRLEGVRRLALPLLEGARLRRGPHRLVLSAADAAGRRVRATLAVRLR